MFLLQASSNTSYNFSQNLTTQYQGSTNSYLISSMDATKQGIYSCSQRSYNISSNQSNPLNITLGKIGSILLCLWTSSQCIVCIKDYDAYHLKNTDFSPGLLQDVWLHLFHSIYHLTSNRISKAKIIYFRLLVQQKTTAWLKTLAFHLLSQDVKNGSLNEWNTDFLITGWE